MKSLAVAFDLSITRLAPISEAEDPIGVGREDGLTEIAALRDVMRYADRHHPRGWRGMGFGPG